MLSGRQLFIASEFLSQSLPRLLEISDPVTLPTQVPFNALKLQLHLSAGRSLDSIELAPSDLIALDPLTLLNVLRSTAVSNILPLQLPEQLSICTKNLAL